MPTYQYACKDCDYHFEEVQAFSDPSLTVCPNCGGHLRKVYGSVGVVFKGSGFYRTDSRSGSDKASLSAQHGTESNGSSPANGGSAAKPGETSAKGESKSAPKSDPKGSSAKSSKGAKTPVAAAS